MYDHRKALPARAHAVLRGIHGEADGLGEFAIAVRKHRHLIVGPALLAPGAHHEGIVDGGAGDLVDALDLEILGLVDEARQMARRAGRRERSRNREQGDLAALEILVRIDRLRSVGGRLDESRLGKLVAELDAHSPFLSLWGMEPTAL